MAYPLFNPDWFAGFFDGEGCVCISHASTGHGRRCYRLSLALSQKDEALLLWLKGVFEGGCVKRSGRHGCFQITWVGNTADRVLAVLRPRCIVKAPQLAYAEQHRYLVKNYHGKVNEVHHALMLSIRGFNRA